MTMCKKMTGCRTSKEHVFYCKQRNRFILRHVTLKKALEGLLQNIYLMLELLYHKPNPLIMIVVDGSTF